MYYNMPLRNITLSTSLLKPILRFASNFVWMFLEWTLTKTVKLGVLPQLFMELWIIMCNSGPIIKKSVKQLTRNLLYWVWRVPRGPIL